MIAGVSITTLLLVLVAGIGAGFVGYAVGASSLISYPALLAFGIPPVLSNTTNTVGVCGTGIGGLLSARKELKGQGRRVAVYACIGLVGGIIGGLLLLGRAFARILHREPRSDNQEFAQRTAASPFKKHSAELRINRQSGETAADFRQFIVFTDGSQFLQNCKTIGKGPSEAAPAQTGIHAHHPSAAPWRAR